MKVLTKGIDVSAWQKNINWDKVKAAGVDFAILRCGVGKNTTSQDDKYFLRNVKECERVGMPYGVYLYSYADTVEKAKSEAEHAIRLLKGLNPQYKVWYDLEDEGTTAKCNNTTILQIAKTFVAALEAKGYSVGIYANTYWNNTKLTDKWYDTKPRWLAQYASKVTYNGNYDIWQYSSKGKVDGIAGNVDMNYCYKDYFAAQTAEKQPTTPAKKSIDIIAKEVIAGKWGNGEERKKRLTAAGYDYAAVQKKVNELCKQPTTPAKKSVETIAKEVIAGKWGNGEERKKRLTAAGYDYAAVQKKVNALIK